MIRFSASLVVVGLGLLVAGGITSKLLLIYISIAVCAVALLFLIIGAIVHRAELLGREPDGIASGQSEAGEYAGDRHEAPEPAATAVGAGASTSRSYADSPGYAESPGSGAATPPDRPRGAPLTRGNQPAGSDFAGYEQFANDADRHRPGGGRDDQRREQPPSRPARPPAEPVRASADPEATRMDLNAAEIRAAGRQERERSERDRPERGRPERSRTDRDRNDRDRADRGHRDQPFADPQPTRMDLNAADIREAGQQDQARPGQERSERDRPERERTDRDRADRGRRDQPFADPQPTRMDLNTADIREAGRREREGTSAGAPAAPQSAPAQPTVPAPARTATGRPDKLLVSRTDQGPAERSRERDRPEAAGAQAPSAAPGPDRPGDNDAGDTQSAGQGTPPSAARPAASPSTGDGENGRAGEAAATREQATLAPAATARDQATGNGKASDDTKSSDTLSGSGSGPVALTDQDVVTVVPGVPRYHRSDCILIRFMGDSDLQRMPVAQARESGCTPCRACQPDGDDDE